MIENTDYIELQKILNEAMLQASDGKGKERHVIKPTPFEDQLICFVERAGLSFCEGQAVKKIFEASRLPTDRAIKDLLGAINYIAANIIVRRGEDK